MTKYVVYSKWFWKDGVPEAAFVQDWLRGRKPNIIATDYVLFKVDNKHHVSVTTYANEVDFHESVDRFQKSAKKTMNRAFN